ncbi:MAG: hypothetical protein IPP64_04350 [Bacteroidetes bacterium]|nr:hypothetical protein [Bacteroidota bacterium]
MLIRQTAIIFLLLSANIVIAQDCILKNAHAHNDYKHQHPLSDALRHKFASIEADIFLVDNELIVSHTRPIFKKHKTLESLYLKPLLDSCQKNNGHVYKNCTESILLLIDVKTDGYKTHLALKKYLEKYKSILSTFKNGKISLNAVTVVITGHVPYFSVQKDTSRNYFIDLSLMNLESTLDSTQCFMVSTKYSNVLSWKGKGEIPKAEKEKLTALVNQAHQQGKLVRLWASPENKNVWNELLNCGVDLINTDELEELNSFLMGIKK